MNVQSPASRPFLPLAFATAALLAACAPGQASTESPGDNPTEAQAEAPNDPASLARVVANLDNFDDLDFNVFSGRKWAELHRSHRYDVVVHWPDGHTTEGIDKHIEDLDAMFVWAPDTRIEEHPIKVGQGEWTAVIGIMKGTFTEPMPIGDGKTIPPTGKAFEIRMATFAHWTEDGPMDEEYLFWDNQEFLRQIGLAE